MSGVECFALVGARSIAHALAWVLWQDSAFKDDVHA